MFELNESLTCHGCNARCHIEQTSNTNPVNKTLTTHELFDNSIDEYRIGKTLVITHKPFYNSVPGYRIQQIHMLEACENLCAYYGKENVPSDATFKVKNNLACNLCDQHCEILKLFPYAKGNTFNNEKVNIDTLLFGLNLGKLCKHRTR